MTAIISSFWTGKPDGSLEDIWSCFLEMRRDRKPEQSADVSTTAATDFVMVQKFWGLHGMVGDVFQGLKAGHSGYLHKVILQQNYHAVSGKAMMVKRELFLKAGGFSEDVEDRMKDVDLCLKLEQLGYSNIYEPGIALILQDHRRGRKLAVRPAAQFMKKWKELLEVPDAFYNCNLSLDDTDFRIRE